MPLGRLADDWNVAPTAVTTTIRGVNKCKAVAEMAPAGAWQRKIRGDLHLQTPQEMPRQTSTYTNVIC